MILSSYTHMFQAGNSEIQKTPPVKLPAKQNAVAAVKHAGALQEIKEYLSQINVVIAGKLLVEWPCS